VILVDTSIWVDHLRRAELDLVRLLEVGQVLIHPFIIGEIACGNLRNREELLRLLNNLPVTQIANHDEVMNFLESNTLYGRGIGYVDLYLLASAALTSCQLWTRDKGLAGVAAALGLDH